MTCKTIVIRDRGTFVPALLVRPGETADDQRTYVLLINLVNNAPYDAFGHGQRTLGTAHRYINEHFDEVENGQVVDVEFLLGETYVAAYKWEAQ